MDIDLLFVLFAVSLIGVLWRHNAERRHVRWLQQEATRSFNGVKCECQDERYCFVGSTAVIERREETGGLRGVFESRAPLSVTIYARNEFGEQFLFKWHSQSKHPPLIKHLGS